MHRACRARTINHPRTSLYPPPPPSPAHLLASPPSTPSGSSAPLRGQVTRGCRWAAAIKGRQTHSDSVGHHERPRPRRQAPATQFGDSGTRCTKQFAIAHRWTRGTTRRDAQPRLATRRTAAGGYRQAPSPASRQAAAAAVVARQRRERGGDAGTAAAAAGSQPAGGRPPPRGERHAALPAAGASTRGERGGSGPRGQQPPSLPLLPSTAGTHRHGVQRVWFLPGVRAPPKREECARDGALGDAWTRAAAQGGAPRGGALVKGSATKSPAGWGTPPSVGGPRPAAHTPRPPTSRAQASARTPLPDGQPRHHPPTLPNPTPLPPLASPLVRLRSRKRLPPPPQTSSAPPPPPAAVAVPSRQRPR